MLKLVLPCLLLFALVDGAAAVADEDSDASLLGYWECESGDCPDEAVEFTERDGEKVYNAWLHDRPSAVDGRWALDGANLDIQCCEDLEFHYTVVKLVEQRLELREADTAEAVVMVRPEGVAGRSDPP